MTAPVTLHHNRVDLALHCLRESSDGHPLLLLHGLGEQAPAQVPDYAAAWTGAVWALDFTGHGASTIPNGGGYTAEVLMGDADAALEHIGPATVFGRGLGGYVALLIAGARPDVVRGAVIADGPGLFGGPSGPTSPVLVTVPPGVTGPPDPFAMLELSRDIRPPDYVLSFARAAMEHSDLDAPLTVSAMGQPPWLAAIVEELLLERTSVADALAAYSR
jgi:pimeloyl-ACP methyl ester carboxylesterase